MIYTTALRLFLVCCWPRGGSTRWGQRFVDDGFYQNTSNENIYLSKECTAYSYLVTTYLLDCDLIIHLHQPHNQTHERGYVNLLPIQASLDIPNPPSSTISTPTSTVNSSIYPLERLCAIFTAFREDLHNTTSHVIPNHHQHFYSTLSNRNWDQHHAHITPPSGTQQPTLP